MNSAARSALMKLAGAIGILLSVPQAMLGAVSVLIGLAIIAWVAYNFLVERQPQFTGGTIPSLGIGPGLVAIGWWWLRSAFRSSPPRITDPDFGRLRFIGSVWSPDGSRLAFCSHREQFGPDIYVMEIKSGSLVKLTNSQGFAMSHNHPTWSPDGRSLVYVRYRQGSTPEQIISGKFPNLFVQEIFVIHLNGSNRRKLSQGISNHIEPAWAPVR